VRCAQRECDTVKRRRERGRGVYRDRESCVCVWWCMRTEACGTSSSERVVVGRTSSSTCLACVWRDCGDRVQCGARSGLVLRRATALSRQRKFVIGRAPAV